MISRAEQHFVAKMKPGKELDVLVATWVCTFKKIKTKLFYRSDEGVIATKPWKMSWFDAEGNLIFIPDFSQNLELPMSLLSALGESSKISRSKEHDMWEIHIGSAKKITDMTNADLAATLCKALIIYVRKFC
jgi:hypothetical protein